MKAVSVILFALACVFAASFVSADDTYTISGTITVGNSTTQQETFFVNNTFYYAPVTMSLSITSITNVENDGVFFIEQNFQMLDTAGGVSVIVSSDPIEGTEETFTPVIITQLFSPCAAQFLRNPTSNLEFITEFASNVTADLEYTFTLTIHNTSIFINQPVTVPTSPVQFFTYISPTFGLTSAFDVKMQLNSTTASNISSAFSLLTVGCPGVGGVISRLYNFTTNNNTQFSSNIAGVKGPIFFTLITANPVYLPDPNYLFQIGDAPDSSSDDELEGWQIALIVVGCVAGAVILAAIVGAVVYLVLRRPGYSKL